MKCYPSLLILLMISLSVSAQESTEIVKEKKNLITISPLSAYGSDYISELGIGLSYERFVNENMSIYMPIGIGLEDPMAQVGAGVKFYPTGHAGVVKYGIAPIFLFTAAERNNDFYYYDSYYPYPNSGKNQYTQFGFMLLNSLNITVNHNVYLGMEGGLGVNYLNRSDSEFSGPLNHNSDVSGIFKLNIGCRF